MNRSTGIILGILIAFASSVAATGSNPPGLPWVTARKPVNISITNGTFGDPALNISTTDDSTSSSFQPTSAIQNSCTAGDGETFSPASILQFTGSYTVGESGVGDASITTPSAVVINRTMTATGANGTPTITASSPVLKVQNDASAAGTGVITDTASTLEVENNNTASTGPGLKITQKATSANAAEFWDVDSLNASIDDQGNVSCRDVTSTNEVRGAVLSTLTAVDLYDPAPSANRISIQAPSGISSWLMILPPNDGNSGDVLTTDGTGTTTWTAPVVGDITAVGSMTSGAAFADATADNAWLGLGNAAGRIEFDDQATDEVNIIDANVGIGTSTPQYILDVLQTQNAATRERLVNASNGGSAQALWQIENDAGNSLQIGMTGSGFSSANYGGNDAYIQANQGDIYIAAYNSNDIIFRNGTNGAQERFRINDDGNVGVGTDSTPDTKLDVQGDFSAGTNGEMSVDTSGNITAIDVAVNGGDITTTAATMNLIPSAATALNIGTTSSSAINVGDSTSYTSVSGLRAKVREVSGTTTIDGNDKNVICDTSGGAATLTLPSAANAGQELTIARKGSDANACNISRAGSDTITLTGAGTGQTNINIGGGSVDSRTCFADGGTIWYCHVN